MSAPAFVFPSYVVDGDSVSVEVDGFTVTATVHDDTNHGAPWAEEDGHGAVTDWTREPKKPGQRVLAEDGNAFRYYDFTGAVALAKADGWGAPNAPKGSTPGQIAALAADADYKALKAWCDDEWHYVGIAVTVARAGVMLTGPYDHALWGVEANYPGSDNAYLGEVAGELFDEAIAAARAKLLELAQ